MKKLQKMKKQDPQIIRVLNKTAKGYQYEDYKNGWILEVINDFGEYYTAKVLTGSVAHTNGVMAVHKGDCELLTLGTPKNDGPETMTV